ncbi:Type II secretion system (T2SS), protein E, N-terminal domain [Malonomonas rubra DSM 5091]|uniref:Type II secretion system (T2SS), protein E, N-terminal domain n=1 Tax=Malonomonas rubra DSM 5091 TaxID=1122189 RepID=A0A1M6LEQ0_MALRU|nr:hypothetical protein [Malonomonas rubra]SHJ69701.1 Type II secretion system (T2SS), protein E, N-terminal domain [Malonomonas rubra DSM 5091]
MSQSEHRVRERQLQKRLGDYLLSKGTISAEQLEEAIENQCIYGGRLGTSLIELGLVGEDELARILSQQLKLHYIKPEALMNVQSNVIKLVPRKLALQYQIVPYHKDKGKLYIAISDTSDLKTIDELSFQLGHILVPLAVPEFRLMLALHKHYGQNLTPRYENLALQLKVRSKAEEKIKRSQSLKKEAVSTNTNSDEEAWPLLGDDNFEDLGGPAPDDETYFSLPSSQQNKNQPDFNHRLVAANERNEIGNALIEFLAEKFQGCALMLVRDNLATGWLGRHQNQELSTLAQLQIPLREASIFNQVVVNQGHYIGIVGDLPHNRSLLSHFSCSPPQTALALPLMVRERLVSILYVQDSLEQLEKNFHLLINAARKTEMAFSMLILKNKILAT